MFYFFVLIRACLFYFLSFMQALSSQAHTLKFLSLLKMAKDVRLSHISLTYVALIPSMHLLHLLICLCFMINFGVCLDFSTCCSHSFRAYLN